MTDKNTFCAQLAAAGFGPPEIIEREGGSKTAEHTHDFAASALILDGEITVITAEASTTCRAGDTFTLAAGVPHAEHYGPHGARILLGRRPA